MLEWMLAVCVGMLTGILSGFGVGGGSLLLIYLSSFAGIPQQQAQAINLLYFLPTAGTALPSHVKNGFVARQILVPAICSGLFCAALTAWLSNSIETTVLRKLFAVFLLYVGTMELVRRDKKAAKQPKDAPKES